MLIKLGWRNIYRNKKRTLVAAITIGIGMASLFITESFMVGMEKNMIKSATTTFLGDAQIHRRGFRDTMELEKTIVDGKGILGKLEKEIKIEAYAPRTMTTAMISSAANAKNVVLFGIDPVLEKRVSKISEAMIRGEFFKSDGQKQILIGSVLAKRIDADIGDKIVITSSEMGTGELAQELFRIGGIFQFNSREMDTSIAFIPIKAASQTLKLEGAIHEIALKFKDLDEAGNLESDFWARHSTGENEALSWKKLIPELHSAIEMSQYSTAIIGAILAIIVAMGIINALFMSIYERFYEFGLLKSIGTRSLTIALMIVSEAASLAIVSIIVGLILTGIFGGYLAIWGVDYSGIEYASVTFTEPIYSVFKIRDFIVFPVVIFFFTVLISIYPAIFASRIVPVEALKKTF